MRSRTTKDCWTVGFDSVADLSKNAAESPKNTGVLMKHSDNEVDWFGIYGGARAVERAVDSGWPEGLAKVRQALDVLTAPKLPMLRRHKTRADFGDELDMQRVYSGQLSSAWSTTKRVSENRVAWQRVTIAVNVAANCGVRADEMFWAGAAAIRIAEALMASGRAVKIIVYSTSNDVYRDGRGSTEYVVVKQAGQPLSLEKIAATTALAGFFRVHMLRARASRPDCRAYSNMGHATTAIPDGLPIEGHAIYVNGVQSRQAAMETLSNLESGMKDVG